MPISPAELSTEPGSPVHLELRGVAAGYGDVPVVRDMDLAVGRGEIVTIVGPNGAGKSTVLKAIVGILRPSEGTIVLAGQPIGGLRTDHIVRRGVGYVPQVRDVFEPLTVRENLEMGGYTLRQSRLSGRIHDVVTLFPALSAMLDRQAGTLSGGERKMLAVGRVLMREPSLLILDEPTAGLSPQIAATFLREHVTRLATTGVAILLVEQRARDALAVSTRGYVMASGRVQLTGPASELLQREDIGRIFLGRSVNRR
jgi:ABC-type branched-subunit amino acid transport system ATPase component